jgi:hypothetical protein
MLSLSMPTWKCSSSHIYYFFNQCEVVHLSLTCLFDTGACHVAHSGAFYWLASRCDSYDATTYLLSGPRKASVPNVQNLGMTWTWKRSGHFDETGETHDEQ